jgi:eukaryotic-like serine/threonine-protein kinase
MLDASLAPMKESGPVLRILFDAMTGMERREDREIFLNYVAATDPALRERLAHLLSLQQEAQDFFDVGNSSDAPLDELPDVVSEDDVEKVGSRIGRYRLMGRIGEGGCGVVYLAEQQEPIKRKVALKIIRLGMDTENVIARFEMERQSLAMMDHPNIARVYDVGATKTGRPFFVMQLVDGEKITDYCDQQKLSIPERMKLFVKVCQAIQHAHQKGVIHRDIKPSNVLVSVHDGEAVPKVIDFGIAKATTGATENQATVTMAGQLMGTPAYMSPEQATCSVDVDTRSDIYSLGALLYELLTGKPPLDHQKLRMMAEEEARQYIREKQPPEPSFLIRSMTGEALAEVSALRGAEGARLVTTIQGDLDRIVMKALAKDRQWRYDTAESLAADIIRYLNNEPVVAQPPSRRYRLMKLVQRNQLLFSMGGIVFLSLVVGLGGASWMYFRANRAREAAELARMNEAALRHQAEVGESVAHAAVLLRYKKIEEADALVSQIPPSQAQPSLESAQTFRALGIWHATQQHWKEAGNRFAAVSYSITGADDSDNDAISLNLLPAAACLCEADDFTGYQALQKMALERFRETSNPVVAEQLIKACLILSTQPDVLEKLAPLQQLIVTTHVDSGMLRPPARNLAAWREFSIALMEFRKRNFSCCLEWLSKCMTCERENQARDAMAYTLRSMCWKELGHEQDSRQNMEKARELVIARFEPRLAIFDQNEPQWQDWLNARILLRQAESMMGRSNFSGF